MGKFARLKGVNVVNLPSHHITRLDHRVKSDLKIRLDPHVANLPKNPTVLIFEKRRGSDTLRVLTGRRGKVKHQKSRFAGVFA